MTSFLIALILLFIGGYLSLYFARLVFSPFFSWFRSGNKLFVFRKAELRIKKADELIEKKDYKKAVKELKKALILKLNNPNLISSVKEHHQNILSRALIIAEENDTRASHIAEVEQLFLARAELQLLYVNAKSAYSRMQNKRSEKGKALPSWSKEEFKRKRKDIEKELMKNLEDLENALDSLFSEVEKQEVVYH